jgi:UDP-N-acetylmuramate dehydrogenase
LLKIEENRPLKPLTTFKIGGRARYFIDIVEPTELSEAFGFAESRNIPVLVLGGGSNMLVADSGFSGLVIRVANRGIELGFGGRGPGSGIRGPGFESKQSEPQTPNPKPLLRIASGERWDDVVKFAVEHDLWGIENLSRIPGRTGAVAVQNVGAYGQEIADVFVNVEVYDRRTKSFRTLTNAEFSYRKSIFNTTEKNRYIILYTTLALSETPKRNLSYTDVKKRFENNPEPSLGEIREAIKGIRDKKFPFPAESVEGNAGSFFKNSLTSAVQFENLREHFESNLPEHLERLLHFNPYTLNPKPHTLIKIPSAFILEACGLKGFRRGDVMLNPSQPVVVLNVTGKATAEEVLSLVRDVRAMVQEKTGLHLYTEPEMIGFTAEELRGYGFKEDEVERYLAIGTE